MFKNKRKRQSNASGSRFAKGKSSRSGRFSKSSNGGSRNPGFGGRRRRNRGKSEPLNISSFINKAVATPQLAEQKIKNCFADFAIDKRIKQAIADRGFVTPTPIQDEIIPYILQGKDVFGLANTGTGKTAAFLIPLINKIVAYPQGQVLVLAPTRELALQIDQEFRAFTHKLGLYSAVCVGGAYIGRQIKNLQKKNHIIIGTPGRLIDLINRGDLKLHNIHSVVLDEADMMFDMGFIDDVRFIMQNVPKTRNTLCFSATLSPKIKALVEDFLNDPITVSVKQQDVSKNIEQDIVKIAGRNKTDILVEHLEQDEFRKVLVFGRTKRGVEKLSITLRQRSIKAESIHGNKSHAQRQRALKKFKQGFARALVATDVASRGLDISGVTHVINFDVPESYDDYVHRIGRTGRGEHRGKAITFVD